MKVDNGFIQLHRKLLENPIFSNAPLLQLFIYCLLKANHKPERFIWNNEEITINRGQFITGRIAMAKDLKQTKSGTYRRLQLLNKLKYISLKSNNKFTLLTVCKYNTYQNNKQRSNNKVTTKEQQSNTNNNDNNDNNKEQEQGEFKKIFTEWYEYKAARRESYKSEQSKKIFENKLLKLSGNNIETAKLIIEQSMANNWAGIFELKNYNNGSIRKTEQRNFAGNTPEKWDEIFNHRGTDGSKESPVSLLSLEK